LISSLTHTSEVPDDVKSIRDFSVELVVRAIALGLTTIHPDKPFDGKLPVEMSSRYKVCSALAKGCTDQVNNTEFKHSDALN